MDFEKIVSIKNTEDFIFELYDVIECQSISEYEDLPQILKVIFSLCQFKVEMEVGGWDNALSNITGEIIDDVYSNLILIKEYKVAELVKKIILKFPNNTIPKDENVRRDILYDFFQKNTEIDFFRKEEHLYHVSKKNISLFLREYIEGKIEILKNALEYRLNNKLDIDDVLTKNDANGMVNFANDTINELETRLSVFEKENQKINLVEIKRLLKDGQRVKALKLYREFYSCSLSEAKENIIKIETEKSGL